MTRPDIVVLGRRAEHRGLLRQFYDSIYVPAFPDPDEREPLANMQHAEDRHAAGFDEGNTYRILLAIKAGVVLGGSICDYLVDPNCGIIGFLAVAAAARGSGIGAALHAATCAALEQDSRASGRDGLSATLIELEDPRRTPQQDLAFDPVARAMFWNRLGYMALRFHYVQSALSPSQKPVLGLLLAARPADPALQYAFPSEAVLRLLRAYIIWAMRDRTARI